MVPIRDLSCCPCIDPTIEPLSIFKTHLVKASSRNLQGLNQNQFFEMGRSFENSKEFVERNGRFPHMPCPANDALPDLHGNYVDLDGSKFICTQYPQEKQCEAFWSRVVTDNCLIIDLSGNEDRCTPYYPSFNEEKKFKNVTVTYAGEKHLNSMMRLFLYKVNGNKVRVIRLNWEDRGALKSDTLLSLINELPPNAFPMIHCKGGTGRTGAMAVAIAIFHKWSQGKITVDNYRQIIEALIITGRLGRGDKFVRTFDQYKMLVHFAESLLGLAPTPADPINPFEFRVVSQSYVEDCLKCTRKGSWMPHFTDDLKKITYVNQYGNILTRNYGNHETEVSKEFIEYELELEGHNPTMVDTNLLRKI